MKIYKITLVFANLDNSLYTDVKATMFFEIKAGDINHAYLMAAHLVDTFKADEYIVE